MSSPVLFRAAGTGGVAHHGASSTLGAALPAVSSTSSCAKSTSHLAQTGSRPQKFSPKNGSQQPLIYTTSRRSLHSTSKARLTYHTGFLRLQLNRNLCAKAQNMRHAQVHKTEWQIMREREFVHQRTRRPQGFIGEFTNDDVRNLSDEMQQMLSLDCASICYIPILVCQNLIML